MTTMTATAEVLGGRKVLKASPRTALEWQEVIQAGMPVRSAEALKRTMTVPDNVFARLLGVSERTLSRSRAKGGRLNTVASDRLFRVARIVALTIDVLEDEHRAIRWLKRGQIGLGGRIPLCHLTTDPGRDEVEKLLIRIEHGVYS